LAWNIARVENGLVTALRILPETDETDIELEMDVLRQLVEDALGRVPEEVTIRLKRNDSIVNGILAESSQKANQTSYDLIAIGASEEWFLKDLLFGSIPDRVADSVPCSVLMVRRYEPAPVSRLRRMIKGRNSRI
jgi:nucleotide-binding universal stress UspA family protein